MTKTRLFSRVFYCLNFCFGVRVEQPDEIRAAIHAAMEQSKPAVVDVVTLGEAHPILKYNLFRKR